MKKFLATVFAGALLLLSGADLSLAGPTRNSDGSLTCTASGPSGAGDGICANTLKENEDFCTQENGGMSSEPGGGTTCSYGLKGGKGGPATQLKTMDSVPSHKPKKP